ncbi:LAGLIDADG family homing endonuclease [Amycolatopsis anabasis]|uniref:LAGLIDADG family homing endonuclease n=1 Tax=Amycolatopsis anabasis TaxID=1840409 RepID=UPI00131EC5AC|nr:LAGLIDADG family homing endonuclease [Amycolatopsis anabasis]
MRWDSQRVDGAEQALLGMAGLLRSVRSPEFNGVTFHEVRARSVLNKVPGGSALPFGWTVNPYRGCSHACTYCLSGDTAILMADGRTKPLAELKVDDEIYGTRLQGRIRRYVPTRVLAHWSTIKLAYRITLEDGTQLIASGDHRFLTDRGWKHVTGTRFGVAQRPHLTTRNRLTGTGDFAPGPGDTVEYRMGYLRGMSKRDNSVDVEALVRAQDYRAGFESEAEFAELPVAPDEAWHKGFLAGVFDAEGRYAHGVLRISSTDPEILEAVRFALTRLVFRYSMEERRTAEGARTVKLEGGLAEQLRFFHTVDPAVTRKRTIDGATIKAPAHLAVTAVEPMNVELPLFDITTGTGDFIANGVVSHNCSSHNALYPAQSATVGQRVPRSRTCRPRQQTRSLPTGQVRGRG